MVVLKFLQAELYFEMPVEKIRQERTRILLRTLQNQGLWAKCEILSYIGSTVFMLAEHAQLQVSFRNSNLQLLIIWLKTGLRLSQTTPIPSNHSLRALRHRLCSMHILR